MYSHKSKLRKHTVVLIGQTSSCTHCVRPGDISKILFTPYYNVTVVDYLKLLRKNPSDLAGVMFYLHISVDYAHSPPSVPQITSFWGNNPHDMSLQPIQWYGNATLCSIHSCQSWIVSCIGGEYRAGGYEIILLSVRKIPTWLSGHTQKFIAKKFCGKARLWSHLAEQSPRHVCRGIFSAQTANIPSNRGTKTIINGHN